MIIRVSLSIRDQLILKTILANNQSSILICLLSISV